MEAAQFAMRFQPEAQRFYQRKLVVCQILIDGYTCLSLTRASATVKRQLMVAFTSLRSASQFLTSSWTTAEASRRRSRHWRCKILSSVSAMFNQLPCLGV